MGISGACHTSTHRNPPASASTSHTAPISHSRDSQTACKICGRACSTLAASAIRGSRCRSRRRCSPHHRLETSSTVPSIYRTAPFSSRTVRTFSRTQITRPSTRTTSNSKLERTSSVLKRLDQGRALSRPHRKLHGHIRHIFHEIFRRIVAIHSRQRRICLQYFSIRRRVEDSLDGMIKDRAILHFRLHQMRHEFPALRGLRRSPPDAETEVNERRARSSRPANQKAPSRPAARFPSRPGSRSLPAVRCVSRGIDDPPLVGLQLPLHSQVASRHNAIKIASAYPTESVVKRRIKKDGLDWSGLTRRAFASDAFWFGERAAGEIGNIIGVES